MMKVRVVDTSKIIKTVNPNISTQPCKKTSCNNFTNFGPWCWQCTHKDWGVGIGYAFRNDDSESIGYGLFATKCLKKDDLVAVYNGPWINKTQYQQKKVKENVYLAYYNKDWSVNGSWIHENTARFANSYNNSGNKANSRIYNKTNKIHRKVNGGQWKQWPVIYAIENIFPGDEITVTYGAGYHNSHRARINRRKRKKDFKINTSRLVVPLDFEPRKTRVSIK